MIAPGASHWAASPRRGGLTAILNTSITLAMWDREPLIPCEEWGPVLHEPWIRETRPTRDRQSIECLLEAIPEGSLRWAILSDLLLLLPMFRSFTGELAVVARLESMHGQSCPKFHTDHVGLRLLCTYSGPGTEWVADPDVDRTALSKAVPDSHTANQSLMRGADSIRSVPPTWVALLKGERWPGNRGKGVLHRSPPLLAGQARLVLQLDTQMEC